MLDRVLHPIVTPKQLVSDDKRGRAKDTELLGGLRLLIQFRRMSSLFEASMTRAGS